MAERLNHKYVIDGARRLGRGGMGEVFAGWTIGAEGFSHPVAIKRIRNDHGDDEGFRARFVREARLVARLSHTNIVTVFDFDRDEAGRLFLVMELVDGIDLADLLRTGALPIPIALFVAAEVLRGLGHAHTLPTSEDAVQGLVHRDISPSNVLISWEGAVKVSDFGFAKAREAMDASASLVVRGKAAYVSPEQATCRAIDGRSDLFSLGVMLWEMLCGESLFGSDNSPETLRRALCEPVAPPHWRRPDVPPDVSGVTLRLLERNREDRYLNAAMALLALSACEDYPKTGRELLSALLRERMPEQARRRIEQVQPPTSVPDFADAKREAARATQQRTSRLEEAAIAPGSEPRAASADPPRLAPRRGRARGALIGAVIATATVTVVAASRPRDTRSDVPRPAPAARPELPVLHQQPSAPRASTRASDGAPIPSPGSAVPPAAARATAAEPVHRRSLAPPAGSASGQPAARGSGILKLDLGPPPPPRAEEAAP